MVPVMPAMAYSVPTQDASYLAPAVPQATAAAAAAATSSYLADSRSPSRSRSRSRSHRRHSRHSRRHGHSSSSSRSRSRSRGHRHSHRHRRHRHSRSSSSSRSRSRSWSSSSSSSSSRSPSSRRSRRSSRVRLSDSVTRRGRRGRSPEAVLEDGTKVLFVGGVSSDMTGDDLRTAFGAYGTVSKVELKETFAYVFMASGGTRAHDEMNGARVGPLQHRIRVEWARSVARGRAEATSPNTTLYVADYDPRMTRDEVTGMFSRFGTIVRVCMCNKFTFIEFERLEDATRAYTEMQGTQCGARTLTVQYARPEPRRDSVPAPVPVSAPVSVPAAAEPVPDPSLAAGTAAVATSAADASAPRSRSPSGSRSPSPAPRAD